MGDGLWDLVSRCWAQTPEDRPSAADIFKLLQIIDLSPSGEIHPDVIISRPGSPKFFANRRLAAEREAAEAAGDQNTQEFPTGHFEDVQTPLIEVSVTNVIPSIVLSSFLSFTRMELILTLILVACAYNLACALV